MRQEEVLNLLKEQKLSGKSIAEFSRERGIPVHFLYGVKNRRVCKAEGDFVRVGLSREPVRITVSELIKVEVPVDRLREVLMTLGVKL